MKINRTFSIDYDLAVELRRKVNQSDIVCRAVRKYLSNSDAPDTSQEALSKQLVFLCAQLFTKDMDAIETGQIITARDTLMAFIQELP